MPHDLFPPIIENGQDIGHGVIIGRVDDALAEAFTDTWFAELRDDAEMGVSVAMETTGLHYLIPDDDASAQRESDTFFATIIERIFAAIRPAVVETFRREVNAIGRGRAFAYARLAGIFATAAGAGERDNARLLDFLRYREHEDVALEVEEWQARLPTSPLHLTGYLALSVLNTKRAFRLNLPDELQNALLMIVVTIADEVDAYYLLNFLEAIAAGEGDVLHPMRVALAADATGESVIGDLTRIVDHLERSVLIAFLDRHKEEAGS